MSRDYKMFGLRMSPQLRERLDEVAAQQKRSLNQEIIDRLERSLEIVYPEKTGAVMMVAQENLPPIQLSDLDAAILKVIKKMPFDKQLALLSLFK